MNDSPNVQTWATAISTNVGNGRKSIFRYAKDLSSVFDPASQPDRVIIVWRYESETGQPVTEEHQLMNLLEDSLEQIVDAGSFATLALVSTGENLREWTYYAKSGEEFIDRLNVAPAGKPVFPIEIHIASDPTWSLHLDFKNGVREVTN